MGNHLTKADLSFNERAIAKAIILPIGARLVKGKVNSDVCQIINCNLDLDPSSPFLDLGNGIRKTKYDYLYNELQWYLSQSLNIDTHPGIGTNQVWANISSNTGTVNSNYGYLVFGKGNYNQYQHVLSKMVKNKHTKQGAILYNRPEMQVQWNDGIHAKSDFICTYATSFMVQDDQLHMCVNMRSNDLTTGFFNDFGWQVFVYKKFLAEITTHHPEIQQGLIHWHADNMHVYERDYDLMKKLYAYYKGLRL